MSIRKTNIVAASFLGLVTCACTGAPAYGQMMGGGMMAHMGRMFMASTSPMAAPMMGQPAFAGMGRMNASIAPFQPGMVNSPMYRAGYGAGGYSNGGGSDAAGGSYGAGSSDHGPNSYSSSSHVLSSGSRQVEVPHPTGDSLVAPPNAGVIQLHIPDQFAVVSFNGQPVSSVGTTRTYVTPNLESGQSGRYEIKATWGTGDQQVSKERVVKLRAGQVRTTEFTRDTSAAPR
jgi:uncharacterized protein (TIGR03000 family)